MSKIVWDAIGEHYFETGVDHGVLYDYDANEGYIDGAAWNGLTAVNESPSGAESNPVYADNIKYLNLISAEDYGGTIEALTTPPEFDKHNGIATLTAGVKIGQQSRKPFGFCYRTWIGNDVDGQEHAYKLHLVYNATASPSEKQHSTVNENPDAPSMSFTFSTTPVPVTGYKPTAIVEIDSRDFVGSAARAKLDAFEAILYGTDGTGGEEGTAPRMPLPDECLSLLR